jgi:phospholipid/cholesterol/gamma-HCH transport system substrate-binding protein
MIRRSTIYQLTAFALLTLVGVSYVTARYIGIGDALFGGSYVVSVDLASSGGIFRNAEVTYRGVTVGRVEELRLTDDGVLADLRLDEGTEVPADTDAVVENRSAVGEQYLDLQPSSASGPFLEPGDTIARERTRTPVPTEKLLVDIDRLVRSVNQQDLVTVVDELGKAFSSGGRDLQRLLDAGDRLTLAATEALPETIKLIEDGKIVLDTQRETGPAIRSFATDLADLSETLASPEVDADLRTVLDRGVIASGELDTLLTENRPAIAGLLSNLVTYPAVVTGGYTVVPGDGTAHFGLVLNADDPPSCRNGYQGTQKTDPNSTRGLPPLNTGARCAEPRGSTITVRGAQNAPAPDGRAAGSRLPSSWSLLSQGRVVGPGTPSGAAPAVVRPGSAPPGTSGADALTLLLLGGQP